TAYHRAEARRRRALPVAGLRGACAKLGSLPGFAVRRKRRSRTEGCAGLIRVRERRRRLAAHDRGGLVNQFVVVESFHHEEGEVDAARDVALENGITHVPAPHGQALTLALLEVATAYDRPLRVAREDQPRRLHLVVEIGEASETRERAEDLHEGLELERVHDLAVECDVPPAREDEARGWRCIVEHRLGRSRRVPVDASRRHHDENAVASRDSAPDDLAVVGRSRDDTDAPLERVELPHALLSAHANHLVTAIQRLPDHVLPKLPRSPNDAHPHLFLPLADRHSTE